MNNYMLSCSFFITGIKKKHRQIPKKGKKQPRPSMVDPMWILWMLRSIPKHTVTDQQYRKIPGSNKCFIYCLQLHFNFICQFHTFHDADEIVKMTKTTILNPFENNISFFHSMLITSHVTASMSAGFNYIERAVGVSVSVRSLRIQRTA